MSVEEESPILITSEDEDGDEVQYIKEEKAPPITIDETDDQEQDDIIFVSTCPAPLPSLPPTWDESLGLTEAMDLDAFSSAAPSCSSSLHQLTPSSNLAAPYVPLTSLLDSSSQDLASGQTLVPHDCSSIKKDGSSDCSLPINNSPTSLSATSSISITHFTGLGSGSSYNSINSLPTSSSSVSVACDSDTQTGSVIDCFSHTKSRFSQVISAGTLNLRSFDKSQFVLTAPTANGSVDVQKSINITQTGSSDLMVSTNHEQTQHISDMVSHYPTAFLSNQQATPTQSNISQLGITKNTGQAAVSSDVFAPLLKSVLNSLLDDLPVVNGMAKITQQSLSTVILPLSTGSIGATSTAKVSFSDVVQSSNLTSDKHRDLSDNQMTSVSPVASCSSNNKTVATDLALTHLSTQSKFHGQNFLNSPVKHFSRLDDQVCKASVSYSDARTSPELNDNGFKKISGNCNSSSSDFFDKLLHSCNSILTDTSPISLENGGNCSFAKDIDSKQVPSKAAALNLPNDSSDLATKRMKHQSFPPICILSNSKLPPRKRVRHSLDCSMPTGAVSQEDDNSDESKTLKHSVQPAVGGLSLECDSVSNSSMSVKGLVVRSCMQCKKLEGERGISGELYTLAQCPNLHTACGECLMVQAKRVLSGKQKESLTCIIETCNSFYPINELKNSSLPTVIVEILQERLDQEMVDFVDKMIAGNDISQHMIPMKKTDTCMPHVSDCLYDSSSVSEVQSTLHELKGDVLDGCYDFRRGDKYRDFPSHWQWARQDDSQNLLEVLAVPVEADSDEYRNVVLRFHEAMAYPQVDVTKVIRIQNPYLWKSYALKREQMLQESGETELNEFQLFHGTKTNTIDAICRRGFDWRFCGKHGTAYGQGSYFAGDSLYSNHYTDRGTVSSGCSLYLKSAAHVANISLLPHSVAAPLPQPPPRSLLSRPVLASSVQAASHSFSKASSSVTSADLVSALQQKSLRIQRAKLLSCVSLAKMPGSNPATLLQQHSSQPTPPATMQSKHSAFSALSAQQRYSYFAGSLSSSQNSSRQSSSLTQPASVSSPASGAGIGLTPLAKHSACPTGKKCILRAALNSGHSATGVNVSSSLSSTITGPALASGSFLGTVSSSMSLAGAPSLALMPTNTASTLPGSSYLLIAPPASSIPLALVPAAAQNSHMHVHVSATVPSMMSKPSWPLGIGGGSAPGSIQALDLRKALVPRYMFLARVLTGRATQGSPDLRRPPPVDPQDPFGPCYDSCVDRLDQPRIWVIFDSTQAYPEYAIEYQVNSDMYR